jgi:hypothetical protein
VSREEVWGVEHRTSNIERPTWNVEGRSWGGQAGSRNGKITVKVRLAWAGKREVGTILENEEIRDLESGGRREEGAAGRLEQDVPATE